MDDTKKEESITKENLSKSNPFAKLTSLDQEKKFFVEKNLFENKTIN